MLGNVFLKALRDQRRALAWWGLGVAAYAVYVSAFWPTIRQNAAQFDRVLQELPDALKAFLGGIGDLVTPTGYLQQQVFQLTGPFLFVIFAIRLGARGLAGEEGDGTLDLLLSTPVPRRRVVLHKLLALIAATGLIGVVLWAGLAAASALFDLDVGPGRLGAGVLSLVLLGIVFGGLALAVGGLTGSRALAIGVGGAAAFAAYLVNALSALVTSLEGAALISPFHYYGASVPLRNGLDPVHVAVLLALAAAFAVGAVVTFERRDIGI